MTRKDCMYNHLARMREKYGHKHYGFVPMTFILPHDTADLQNCMSQNPNRNFIIKPSSSSQGKGIFITNNFSEISNLRQSSVVSEYIDNPMLIDGYKFDLRIYVALTSINPLRIYIYEDGLVRFATVKYSSNIQGNKSN
jgi:hypothetical protein